VPLVDRKCFPAKAIVLADCDEIEAGHAKKKGGKARERNWEDEEIEM